MTLFENKKSSIKVISDKKRVEEYYQALLERNSHYLGVFYAAVKTTGVFCIATCRARKPKKQNVLFFPSVKEALNNGFRPCKVCNPTQNVGETPDEIKNLITMLSRNPEIKIKDFDLRELGYNPEIIRRWFKTHFEMTFQAYQRMLRINTAYEKLKNGNPVTASAYDSGYESLSGFGYSFKNILNTSPENANEVNVIHLHRFTTPLGPMYACATAKGICLLEFTDRKKLETEFNDLTKLLKAKIIVGKNSHLINVEGQIKEYFDGNRHSFDVPLDTPGTTFQKNVWRKLLDVPYGQTYSYKQLANAVEKPSAVRAVANANGHNRVAIIIPCHRIIGSDGQLTGYGGGLPRKKWLLDHEQNFVSKNI